MVAERPFAGSHEFLDRLLSGLETKFKLLTDCYVEDGWALTFQPGPVPSIHYALSGRGHMVLNNDSVIPLTPHTLIILPAAAGFSFKAGHASTFHRVIDELPFGNDGAVHGFHAGHDPSLHVVCGYLTATYGLSINLFREMGEPIVERFDARAGLETQMRAVLGELRGKQLGAEAISSAHLKSLLIVLLRRSLQSAEVWAKRFPLLADEPISRAFSAMVASPGADHSISGLMQVAGLGRSTFMTRFMEAVGLSPLVALRQLRMRRAANLLVTSSLSVEDIGKEVGYSSRTSFSRAFRSCYKIDPSEFRDNENRTPSDFP
jgi:AraC family transcriptional activator of mtrCDE